MNVKDIRRQNLRSLAEAVGGITKMAKKLSKSQSQISHLIGNNPVKNIGDRVAAQAEEAFEKPSGWLDMPHYGIAEAATLYEIVPDQRAAPLITWDKAKDWQEANANIPYERLIPCNQAMGIRSFALKVQGDSMESPAGISFPNDAIIIIDPDHEYKSGSFVVAKLPYSKELTFKQLSIDSNCLYLKPLNPRYPLVPIPSKKLICGVVRQVICEIE